MLRCDDVLLYYRLRTMYKGPQLKSKRKALSSSVSEYDPQ